MKKLHLKMAGIALLFGLVLGSCENGTQEVEGTVNLPGIEGPGVTAEAVTGGVRLTWDPIVGVSSSSYAIWRSDANVKNKSLTIGSNLSSDPKTGKLIYLDLVSDTNELTANTEYTYTVIAQPNSAVRDNSQWTGSVTPTNIPAKGEKLAAPSAVVFTLDSDKNQFEVTVTPPASGNIPTRYTVMFYRDNTQLTVNGGSSITITAPATTGTATFSSWQDGTYTARVTGIGNSYYESSDAKVSASQTYEALFETSVYAGSPSPIYGSGGSNYTIVGYYSNLTVSGKPEVTYTVKRAPVDAAGNTGTYASVTLSSSSISNVPVSSWTTDLLGNLPSVYDLTLPSAAGSYKYEITAKKGSLTQTKETSTVTVNPRTYIYGSIAVSNPTTPSGDNRRYSITPTITYKGALQDGDKLVLYWAKSYSYQSNYLEKLEFTKVDLESGTSKNLDVPSVGSYNIYMQAYLVLADGTKTNVSQSWMSSGNGIQYINSGYDSNYNRIYYAVLYK